MPYAGKVLAWIEQRGRGEAVAAFRSAAVPDRPPATRVCPSPHQAKAWVEKEAAALGVSVEWVAAKPRGSD
jgi:hypothetical protein